MWYNLIFVLVIFFAVFIGYTGYALAKDSSNSAFDQLSKLNYADKLGGLPETIYDGQEPVSAMCYDVAAPMRRMEYVCPACNEKTFYFDDYDTDVDQIPYCRKLVKKITKLDVKLDESQLCQKCSPKAESRELCIIVKPDKKSKPHKTCHVTEDDITLLYEYSEGMNIHTDYFGRTSNLDDHKQRLEELLGKSIQDMK